MSEVSLEDQIQHFIVEKVNENWASKRVPLLLSSLGGAIKLSFPKFESAMPDGLKKFLLARPAVQVVTHPKFLQKVGAVPLAAKLPENIADIFGSAAYAGLPAKEAARPSYDKDFWNSFIYKFSDRRFVIVDKLKNVFHLSDSEVNDDNTVSFEILESDQLNLPRETEKDTRVNEVHNKILVWINRNKLSENLFHKKYGKDISYLSQKENSDLFEVCISHLDQSDLSRIFVPMDIVKKMLKSR